MPDYIPVNAHTIVGAVEAKFDSALRRVLEDIANPAKQAEATREIVIRVKLKPDETRESAIIESDVDARLARSKPTKSFMLLSLGDDGGVTASVSNARQLSLEEQLESATRKREA